MRVIEQLFFVFCLGDYVKQKSATWSADSTYLAVTIAQDSRIYFLNFPKASGISFQIYNKHRLIYARNLYRV